MKPGGVIGIRCVDLAATLIAPDDGTRAKANEIWFKYRAHSGGDPFLGRRLRGLLHEAGFESAVGTASRETWDTTQRTGAFVFVLIDEFTGSKITETALELGWADQARMGGVCRALTDWGGHADAFMAIMWCEGVGWKNRAVIVPIALVRGEGVTFMIRSVHEQICV